MLAENPVLPARSSLHKKPVSRAPRVSLGAVTAADSGAAQQRRPTAKPEESSDDDWVQQVVSSQNRCCMSLEALQMLLEFIEAAASTSCGCTAGVCSSHLHPSLLLRRPAHQSARRPLRPLRQCAQSLSCRLPAAVSLQRHHQHRRCGRLRHCPRRWRHCGRRPRLRPTSQPSQTRSGSLRVPQQLSAAMDVPPGRPTRRLPLPLPLQPVSPGRGGLASQKACHLLRPCLMVLAAAQLRHLPPGSCSGVSWPKARLQIQRTQVAACLCQCTAKHTSKALLAVRLRLCCSSLRRPRPTQQRLAAGGHSRPTCKPHCNQAQRM